MTKSRLSDSEKEDILSFVLAENANGVFEYVDRLLYEKGLGTDCCARPIEYREKEHMEHPCFAMGYIEKIEEYFKAISGRKDIGDPVELTSEYIRILKVEINKFFKRRSFYGDNK